MARETLNFQEDEQHFQIMEALKTYYQGRGCKYKVETYGCQMNEHDSEKLSGLMHTMGLEKTDISDEADIILFNTCCVRERAEIKVFGNVGALRSLKEQKPDMVIGVCGCMMQQPEVARKLSKKYPFVDLIFGTNSVHLFPHMLLQTLESGHTMIQAQKDVATVVVEGIPSLRREGCLAWVNIMYGCDNYCSYCIVPYVRGRERSREPYAIVEEIRQLVSDGCREVMLLGQNVNSYGKGLPCEMSFPSLLCQINAIDGLDRIRFMTSHPKDLTEDLIEAMATLPKLAHHIHLPVQSGSDAILKAMNRRYTSGDYLSLVEKLRSAVPDIAVTTDFIVGYPGETAEDIQATIHLAEAVRFDTAFSFKYSKRQGTHAATMENQVPEDVKKQRLAQLNTVLFAITDEKLRGRVGHTEKILVETVSARDPAQVSGRTSGSHMVHFTGDKTLIGSIVTVRITAAKAHTLVGEKIEEVFI